MQLTNQRKVYLGVLLIAGAAFMADQMFLGGGKPAGALASPGSGTSDAGLNPPTPHAPGARPATGGAKNLTKAGPSVGSQGGTLAARLEASSRDSAAAGLNASDPFHGLGPWVAPTKEESVVSTAVEPPKEAGPSKAELFAMAHKLRGVSLVRGGLSSVMIDGEMKWIGDTVDGFTLTSVERDKAVFALDGESVTLTLEMGTGAKK